MNELEIINLSIAIGVSMIILLIGRYGLTDKIDYKNSYEKKIIKEKYN